MIISTFIAITPSPTLIQSFLVSHLSQIDFFENNYYWIEMLGESSCWVGANMLDYNIIVSEFELWSWYNVHFQTNILRKVKYNQGW